MTAAEDNAAVVRRYRDLVWNNGEVPVIEELVDDDFTNFGIRRLGGHAALRHIVTAWRTAFPRPARGARPGLRRQTDIAGGEMAGDGGGR